MESNLSGFLSSHRGVNIDKENEPNKRNNFQIIGGHGVLTCVRQTKKGISIQHFLSIPPYGDITYTDENKVKSKLFIFISPGHKGGTVLLRVALRHLSHGGRQGEVIKISKKGRVCIIVKEFPPSPTSDGGKLFESVNQTFDL